MMKSIHHSDSGNTGSENHLFSHGILENQIQALSRSFRHWFRNFQGPRLIVCFPRLSRPWKSGKN